MEELLLLLSSIYPMSEGLVTYLLSTLVAVELPKNKFLLKKGHLSNHIYFVKEGLLRCYFLEEDRKETSSWFMGKGDVIVSVDSFYSRTRTQEPIHALKDSLLYGISYDQLQFAFREYLEFNFHGRVLTEKYYLLSERRASIMRRFQAPERYLYTKRTQPEILQDVPARHIASYLGIDEATLSRIKKKYD